MVTMMNVRCSIRIRTCTGTRAGARTNTRGFTYLGLLFAVVLLGVVASIAMAVWHTQSRREKEQELLFVGEQYMKAIAAYRAVQVNGQGSFPKSLNELLEDRRFPMPVRHLRKRYPDPVTNSSEWGLVPSGEGIAGVYSLASELPLKQAGFGSCCSEFTKARSYADWKFVAATGAVPALPSAPGSPSASGASSKQP
jgi:type II secretory pathway pseudopilin PulG